MEYALPIVVFVALAILVRLALRQVTVLEYEKGLRYVKGKFEASPIPVRTKGASKGKALPDEPGE